MSVRRATVADAAAMADVHAAAFALADAWGADVFRLQLALPTVHGALHAQGGLVMLRMAADEAEILTLAVVPAARRGGIATRLLQAAEATARRGGALKLFLEVSTGNNAAGSLYEKRGFQQIGRRPVYYADRSDALVLCRDL